MWFGKNSNTVWMLVGFALVVLVVLLVNQHHPLPYSLQGSSLVGAEAFKEGAETTKKSKKTESFKEGAENKKSKKAAAKK